jgi:hypothetical protein
MRILKALAHLRAREVDFRIKELRRLLKTYQRDPNFTHSCTAWRRELTDLRSEQVTGVAADSKFLPGGHRKAKASPTQPRGRPLTKADVDEWKKRVSGYEKERSTQLR